jgi:UbiD family decarboxylase
MACKALLNAYFLLQQRGAMSYKDVREWIQKVDEMGELKIVENADWNLEIGALSVLSSKHKENTPALLFDRIKDYPAGYRILVGFFESFGRSAHRCMPAFRMDGKLPARRRNRRGVSEEFNGAVEEGTV